METPQDKSPDQLLCEIITEQDDPKAVLALLQAGAGVNTPDEFKSTPLHYAVEHNRVEIAKVLLEQGADTEAQELDGNTPLLLAVKLRKNPEMIMLLVDNGADIEAKDPEGKDAFSSALGYDKRIPEKGNHWFLSHRLYEDRLNRLAMKPENYGLKAVVDQFLRLQNNSRAERTAMMSVMMRTYLVASALVNVDVSECNDVMEQLLINLMVHAKGKGLKSWKELAAPMMQDTCNECINTKDMVKNFTTHVVLPKSVEMVYGPAPANTTADYKDNLSNICDFYSLDYNLRLPTAKVLYGSLLPHQIVGLSRAWHQPAGSIPTEWKPFAKRQWHPLTPTIEIKDGKHKGWSIHCLSDSDMLDEEAKHMKNCIARGDYQELCISNIPRNFIVFRIPDPKDQGAFNPDHFITVAGNYHLFSIRNPQGQRVSNLDLLVSLNGKIYFMENTAYKNGILPEDAKEIAEWFMEQLKGQKIPMNPIRGETKESYESRKTAPYLHQYIGYNPTPENIERIYTHFAGDGLKAVLYDHKHDSFYRGEERLVRLDRKPARGEHRAQAEYTQSKAAATNLGLNLWLRATGLEEEIRNILNENSLVLDRRR